MKCSDCFENLFKKCEDAYKKRLSEEENHFETITKGLKESMVNFDKVLGDIKDWEELMSIKEVSLEEKKLKKSRTIKEGLKKKKDYFFMIGFIFCLFQLIGVQEGIIFLNSLFSEIFDEFKLWLNGHPREFNFYQKLEINSYRELPEMIVGMITSSIGIVVLKNLGFKVTNLIFQFISSGLFLLLFLLFKFHTDNKLLENYNRLEILVLVISYIILSILVGCSSTIALKEYTDLYSQFYYQGEKLEEVIEKTLLYVFSGLSSFLIMIINRKIFTSIEDIKSKLVLIWFVGICLISFILSLIFHALFTMAIVNKKEKEKKKNEKNNSKKESENKEEDKNIEKESNNKIENNNNEEEKTIKYRNNNKKRNSNKYKKGKEKKRKSVNEINIENSNENKEVPENDNIGNNSINKNKHIKFQDGKLQSQTDSEMITIKNNKNIRSDNAKNDDIKIENIEDKSPPKKQIYSTKVCTLCGYIYFKNEEGNQKACIIYHYTTKCNWLKEKIIKIDVIFSIVILLFCQSCIVGFNTVLYDKLLYDYSYKKNIKFFIALFVICIFFGWFAALSNHVIEKNLGEEKDKSAEQNKKEISCFESKSCYYIFSIMGLLLGFIIFTFISSFCYYFEKNISKTRWDNIIMAEFIFFKSIDMSLLTYYNFFDNTDLINTTLFITLEKFLWMIIEEIIDAFKPKVKALIIFQIIISGIPIILWIFMLVLSCIIIS